jgi:hypothetical protein
MVFRLIDFEIVGFASADSSIFKSVCHGCMSAELSEAVFFAGPWH